MKISWYFDFISPFAYLQCEQLDRLPPNTAITYRPVLFAGLLNHWGHKGPAEIPAKRRFTYQHVLWIAQQQGVPLLTPPTHPFNPLSALRLAIALGSEPDVVRSIFRFIWAEGHCTDQEQDWAELVERLNVGDADNLVAQDEVKGALRSNTEEAIALGVFGVPTIIAGKELFWGNDSTEMAAAYLQDPDNFNAAEMRQIDDIPIGIERPR